MTLVQAERLIENEDFKAFLELLKSDVEQIKEDLIYQQNVEEMQKVQIRLQTIRLVASRLGHVIEELRKDQEDEQAARVKTTV